MNLTKKYSRCQKIETLEVFLCGCYFEKYDDYAAKSLLQIMYEYSKILGEYKNIKKP
jgi:hypothetical protein